MGIKSFPHTLDRKNFFMYNNNELKIVGGKNESNKINI